MTAENETDDRLIARFVEANDADAMRVLVRRYQGIVRAAAFRQVGSRERAEDVAQAVFLVLTQKAGSLRGHQTLGGWLIKVTRFAAIDAMRKQNRRLHHEQAAARLGNASTPTEAAAREWEALSPLLDAALARLKPAERDAVVLRYFRDLPFGEVGKALDISEEAARKRVDRAVGRLRQLLLREGTTVNAAAFGPLLAQHGAAGGMLDSIVVGSAPAGSAGSVGSASAGIAQGVIKMMGWTSMKLIGAVSLSSVVIVAGAAALLAARGEGEPSAMAAQVAPPVPGLAPPVLELTGAADLYARANDLILVDAPAASTLEYPAYPPFGEDWTRLAKDADEKNRPARELAREARAFASAEWPAGAAMGDVQYLSPLRNVANELGDSALYLHLEQRRDLDAVEAIRDMLHLSGLLRGKQNGDGIIRLLVAIGIDGATCARLQTMAPGLNITPDGKDGSLSVAEARKLIAQLLDFKSADAQFQDARAAEQGMQNLGAEEKKAAAAVLDPSFKRIRENIARGNAERAMTAISLACQLYRIEHQRWPATLAELIPNHLPQAVIDPFGDGKQSIGYVLIPGGLPDGADRPLVYSRAESPDGLFYRLDQPCYGFYTGDGTDRPMSEQRKGGQFRDIARWVPAERPAGAPTTADLPR